MSEKYYAGIGSRKTPANILELMTETARQLFEREGYVLRSGGAQGADTAFERGGGAAEIFRPFGEKRGFQGIPAECWARAAQLASEVHPAWHRCSHYAKALHARNCFQVLGPDLQYHSKFVLCWTPDAAQTAAECTRETGGTGTAIRLADRYGIQVLNLANAESYAKVTKWLG